MSDTPEISPMFRIAVVFCPYKKAEEVAQTLGFYLVKTSNLREGLLHLNNGNPVVVTDQTLSGWRAPARAYPIFVEGFPQDGPIRVQAEGRFPRRQ